ncbi:Signal transduction histidine-protein kinase/phosphatase MprB [Baekduia alba]|uniref:sensor histidine kinase n=1 Tax=Baekduia alba TaxID=2997333 RepID=UPI0023423BC8|nr:HAMP domain-containing sensor histidine kinase [Baekduia alba]WCB97044.1 Signal transduction histidine-protein kinase/phosphatase MprB [Baekduia alba]
MTLRRRVTLMSALVVGATLVLASVTCYFVMRGELRGQIDDSLREQGHQVARIPPQRIDPTFPRRVPQPQRRTGASQAYVQFVSADGTVRRPPGSTEPRLPVTAATRAIARSSSTRHALQDTHADGAHLRMLTVGVPGRGAVQLARSLTSVDRALSRLRIVLVLLTVVGTAFAALLARILSRPVAAPTEHELAVSQGALADSLAAQRQLVADASHELRTPVTSVRTNAEMLRDASYVPDDERRLIAGEVVEQAEELTALIGDLIDLARGDVPDPAVEDVRLDALAYESVQRARRHAPGLDFRLDAEPCVVEGAPERLARAINNLLDNAAKHSPDGAAVEVTLRAGVLTARDHGPGIDPDDLPHVFDRFHRGANARGRPGSGLGLAIVRQVAEAHGGSVALEAAPGGGTLARLTLPAERVETVTA